MLKTLIIPGLGGSEPGHWQREWSERDPGAEIVEQKEWSRPVLSDWIHVLEARIQSAPGVVLVAHSLGCALVAALARTPAASHVSGALLVAPVDVDRLAGRHESVGSFCAARHRLPFPSILIASRNDPFMDFSSAIDHAAKWGSALVDLGHAGHVNVASGYGHWPDASTLADGLRQRPRTLPRGPDAGWRWWNTVHPHRGPIHDAGLGIN